MRLNAGVRAFLWVVKAPARLRTELAERYRQPPEPGSVIIADEQEIWTAVAPNLNANDAANDGRAIRWMIVAGGPGTSLLDLGEGEDSNLATGQVMTEMRRRFLRRRQAYLAWLLTDLVLVAWRRYAAGERRLRHNVTAADITAVLPDICVEDNQKLAQAAMQLATGLSTVAQLVGSGPAYRKMALRWFVKFAGEQITEGEIAQMIHEGHEGHEGAPNAVKDADAKGHVQNRETMVLASEPAVVEAGVLWAGLDRAELRKQHAAGELQELEFEAMVFRAAYPNWNYVRFRARRDGRLCGELRGRPLSAQPRHAGHRGARWDRDGVLDGRPDAGDARPGQADDGGGHPAISSPAASTASRSPGSSAARPCVRSAARMFSARSAPMCRGERMRCTANSLPAKWCR